MSGSSGLRTYANERNETFKRWGAERRRAQVEEDGEEPEPDETLNHFRPPEAYVLKDLPLKFSFSKFLSPRPVNTHRIPKYVTVSRGGQAVDPTYMILLAPNEECRMIKRRCFYHLPLRQGIKLAHPADLVFVDEDWSDFDVESWDWQTWEERLKSCEAEGRIEWNEHVIPVCCRILKIDMPANATGNVDTFMHCPLATNVDTVETGYQPDNIYASRSDPAVEKHNNVFAWSLPTEDQSRMLIVYPHHHASPYMCPNRLAMAEATCKEMLTPDDLSNTFVPYCQRKPITVFGERVGEAENDFPNKKPGLLDFPFRNHRELILVLLYVWNQGPIPHLHGHLNLEKIEAWKDMLGTAKLSWQELQNVFQSHNEEQARAFIEVLKEASRLQLS